MLTFQIFVSLGKVLLIYHPDKSCKFDPTITSKGEFKSTSTLNVKVAPMVVENLEYKDENNALPRLPSSELKIITDWIGEKDMTDAIRSQWCHMVAVMDRVILITFLIFTTATANQIGAM